MVSDFKFVTFSVFDISDFSKLTDAVREIFKKKIEKGKVALYERKPIIKEYINPKSGGSHFPKFSCWQNKIYNNKVFFISNYEDGLANVCRNIQKHLRCNAIMCALSNETENPFFKFHYFNSNLQERLLQAYKEDKWVFYEEGTPLPFENLDYYKNRLIKNRLNNSIIKEYLLKTGVDFCLMDSQITNGIEAVRKEW